MQLLNTDNIHRLYLWQIIITGTNFDGSAQDYSNSIANKLESLQSCSPQYDISTLDYPYRKTGFKVDFLLFCLQTAFGCPQGYRYIKILERQKYIENNVCTRVANCFCILERVILVIISRVPELCSNEGNKHQNNTWESAETVRHESTYIILFLTQHSESINDAKMRIFTHHPCVSLARCTFCWWRHIRLAMTSQWPDNCDTNTWQVISNSFDIDFIHSDIHGRLCR